MDYDLNRLGEREFEHLTQALAMEVLGNGVEVFGDGADGGREATFDGPVDFPIPDPGGPWNGYGVIQAKFHYRPRDAGEGASWLKGQLKTEFDKWLASDSKRGRRPEYFLAVSNVMLSPYPETGGVDSVNALIAEYAPRLGLMGWKVWHYDKLCRLLDANPGIANKYSGLITPGDVLARMYDYIAGVPEHLGKVLTTHVVRELRADQSVRLGQAGDQDDQGIALDKVAVDLPATLGDPADEDITVVAHVIARGNRVLRPSSGVSVQSRLVVLGGPGQGKTTLAQLICQAYRVALLTDRPETELIPEVRALLKEFQGPLLGALGITLPTARRWPVLIRLDQYADAITNDAHMTLLRYIAARVSRRAAATVTDSQLAGWLEQWPWLVVLDGFDEVADQAAREELLRHVDEFRDEAAQRDADLLLVATTRPQGYADEFDPKYYEYLHLRPLEADEAVQYAERLAAARHAVDLDRREQVVQRVRSAAGQARTARLMRSPLQVTIMSLLLERRGSVPEQRYELFKGYYEVVLAREKAKATVDAELLKRHSGHVEALQDVVGLVLQMRSERQGDAEAALPESELRALAASILKLEQYDPDTADDLATKLLGVALRRLVLLVPLPGGGVGFEVRSLQEFMAARALVSGPDLQIVTNLTVLIPSAHWRNTWLLAAGRLFAERPHLRADLLTAMRAADAADALSFAVAPGARLAVDLLEEGIADESPGIEEALVRHALELLRKTPDQRLVDLAEVLAAAMARRERVYTLVEAGVAEGLSSAGPAALSAMLACAVWANGTGSLPGRARRWLDDGRAELLAAGPQRKAAWASLVVNYPLPLLRDSASGEPGHRGQLGLNSIIDALPIAAELTPQAYELVTDTFATIAKGRLSTALAGDEPVLLIDRGHLSDLSRLDGQLADQQVARAIIRVVDGLGVAYWPLASLIRQALRLWMQRQPVAGRLALPPAITGHGW